MNSNVNNLQEGKNLNEKGSIFESITDIVETTSEAVDRLLEDSGLILTNSEQNASSLGRILSNKGFEASFDFVRLFFDNSNVLSSKERQDIKIWGLSFYEVNTPQIEVIKDTLKDYKENYIKSFLVSYGFGLSDDFDDFFEKCGDVKGSNNYLKGKISTEYELYFFRESKRGEEINRDYKLSPIYVNLSKKFTILTEAQLEYLFYIIIKSDNNIGSKLEMRLNQEKVENSKNKKGFFQKIFGFRKEKSVTILTENECKNINNYSIRNLFSGYELQGFDYIIKRFNSLYRGKLNQNKKTLIGHCDFIGITDEQEVYLENMYNEIVINGKKPGYTFPKMDSEIEQEFNEKSLGLLIENSYFNEKIHTLTLLFNKLGDAESSGKTKNVKIGGREFKSINEAQKVFLGKLYKEVFEQILKKIFRNNAIDLNNVDIKEILSNLFKYKKESFDVSQILGLYGKYFHRMRYEERRRLTSFDYNENEQYKLTNLYYIDISNNLKGLSDSQKDYLFHFIFSERVKVWDNLDEIKRKEQIEKQKEKAKKLKEKEQQKETEQRKKIAQQLVKKQNSNGVLENIRSFFKKKTVIFPLLTAIGIGTAAFLGKNKNDIFPEENLEGNNIAEVIPSQVEEKDTTNIQSIQNTNDELVMVTGNIERTVEEVEPQVEEFIGEDLEVPEKIVEEKVDESNDVVDIVEEQIQETEPQLIEEENIEAEKYLYTSYEIDYHPIFNKMSYGSTIGDYLIRLGFKWSEINSLDSFKELVALGKDRRMGHEEILRTANSFAIEINRVRENRLIEQLGMKVDLETQSVIDKLKYSIPANSGEGLIRSLNIAKRELDIDFDNIQILEYIRENYKYWEQKERNLTNGELAVLITWSLKENNLLNLSNLSDVILGTCKAVEKSVSNNSTSLSELLLEEDNGKEIHSILLNYVKEQRVEGRSYLRGKSGNEHLIEFNDGVMTIYSGKNGKIVKLGGAALYSFLKANKQEVINLLIKCFSKS